MGSAEVDTVDTQSSWVGKINSDNLAKKNIHLGALQLSWTYQAVALKEDKVLEDGVLEHNNLFNWSEAACLFTCKLNRRFISCWDSDVEVPYIWGLTVCAYVELYFSFAPNFNLFTHRLFLKSCGN